MSGSGRRGATLVEAIVALLVGLLLMQLGLSTLARFRTAQSELAERADALIAQRVGRHVLRRELRHATAGRDWLTDADSLSLRAFRGTGIVCANDSVTAELIVAYRGDRGPDSTKDSVLLFAEDGTLFRRRDHDTERVAGRFGRRGMVCVPAAQCGPARPGRSHGDQRPQRRRGR